MKLITKQSKVIPGITSFLKLYPSYHSTNAPFYTEQRYNNIKALDPATCTVQQFNEAIECTHWTDNRCYECEDDFDTLVHIGDDPAYDARWQCLCKGCLRKAIELLDSAV